MEPATKCRRLSSQVPNEILTMVFRHFRWKDVHQLRRVCIRWKLVIDAHYAKSCECRCGKTSNKIVNKCDTCLSLFCEACRIDGGYIIHTYFCGQCEYVCLCWLGRGAKLPLCRE